MEKEEIIKIVNEFNRERQGKNGPEVEIIADKTIEKSDFFVFFYNSKDWIKTKDPLDILLDNYPYIVRKSDGKIFVTGDRYEIEDYIEYFEKYGELKTSGPAWWEEESESP